MIYASLLHCAPSVGGRGGGCGRGTDPDDEWGQQLGYCLIVMMIMWARAQQSVELSTMGLREIPQCLDKAHLANSLHLAWCLKRFFLIVKALASTFNKENLRGLLQALWYFAKSRGQLYNQSVTCLFVKTITRNCFPALVIIMGYLHFSTPRTQGISLWVGPWASVALRGQGGGEREEVD